MKSHKILVLLILTMAALPAGFAAGRPAADAQTQTAGIERIDAAVLAIKEMTELTKTEEKLPKALLQDPILASAGCERQRAASACMDRSHR